ncbi:MAG: cytochrome c3 family protein [Planctomycetota bacterium]
MSGHRSKRAILLAAILLVASGTAISRANSLEPVGKGRAGNEECLECHGDRDLSTERDGQTLSLFVDAAVYGTSVHGGLDCVDCHTQAAVEEFPHPERLAPVACGTCHDEAEAAFARSIHGQKLAAQDPLAPTCSECHGKHDIFAAGDPSARTFKMNSPFLCGSCHKEGEEVARRPAIPEHDILEHYTESMHGEGLFKKGLIGTATCTDCHGSHTVLPHTDPESSIAPKNVAATCMKCHARIEQVHVRVIKEGRLWEEEPGKIPACTDCHRPHEVAKSKVNVSEVSNQSCLKCHGNASLSAAERGPLLDVAALDRSVHRQTPCVKCHSDIDARLRPRPCEPAGRVNCSSCHAALWESYLASGHGQAHELSRLEDAPYCTTCHGTHDILSQKEEASPTFRGKVPSLCGGCHKEDGKAATVPGLIEVAAFSDYSKSVHGRRLQNLLPSAVCTDCHTAHGVYRHTDPRSSVYKETIPATCGQCHLGITEQFVESVHFSEDHVKEKTLPICSDCHSAHTIAQVEADEFVTQVTQQCGSCHRDLSETYFDTTHGKAYRLGHHKAAKCSDCHGDHHILGANDPASTVSARNIVGTCRKCHEDANERFTGYLTHATHHDRVKYPILFYTYWFMTLLLTGVFVFFGIHTLLWLPRSFSAMRLRLKEGKEAKSRYYIRRFTLAHRVTHLFVIVSFLSLAATGMALKFSGMPWAKFIDDAMGGVAVASLIHRAAALVTFGYFLYHLVHLVRTKLRRGMSWSRFILGPNSLMFNKKDLTDFWATIKWFVGKGRRPSYGRWTYWEKFDYFAVFWGVAVIGLSGLIKWYPEFFTKFVPGWVVNVAAIVHSDEALLAVGFIFTVHFFNTHLRPEAFPMDKVIFTGLVPLDDFKKDRTAEYEALVRSGSLGKHVVVVKVNPHKERAIMAAGLVFLAIGLTLVALIIYSVVFGYG